MGGALGSIGRALWRYLRDWKNLLTHSLIGVAIILVAAFLPVRPVLRIAILAVVVGLNVLRMRLERRSGRA